MKQIISVFLVVLLCGHLSNAFAQNALHFDGSNDNVQTTYSGVLGTANRTFEAWIKVDVGATASNLCILDYGVNAVGSRNTFSVTGTRGITFISGGTNANISSSSNVITEGQWTHVAFVLNSGTGYLYVNGSQVGTGNLSTVNTPSGNQKVKFGERVTGGSIPFEGAIDEVRIWDVARTGTEIANNRNAEFCTLPANLVAYYNFNQGTAGGTNTGINSLIEAVSGNNGSLNGFSLSGSTSNWVTGATLSAGLSSSKITTTACDSMVSPSGNYVWTASGNYTDTMQNANNCDSLINVALTVFQSLYTVVNDSSCDPYPSPSGKYVYTTSGTYYDTLSLPSGCDWVMELNLVINIIDTTVTVTGHTIQSNQSNAVYNWLDCNNDYSTIAGATSQSYTPTVNGDYAARIFLGGCLDTTACIGVNTIGIADDLFDQELQVYPNPVRNTLYISTLGIEGDLNFQIISAIGEVVLKGKVDGQIDVSKLESGLYWIQFTGTKKTTTRTFLKE